MKKFIYILLFFSLNSYSQKIFSGYVYNENTKETIACVKVGIVNGLSVLTDSSGYFTFIRYEANGKNIEFMKPGYLSKKVSMENLQNNKIIIKLKPISSCKVEKEDFIRSQLIIQGNKRVNSSTLASFPSDSLGAEIGILIGNVNKRYKLKSLNFYITQSKLSMIRFRINVYNYRKKVLGKNINREEIIISRKIDNFKAFEGWININIEPFNIVINDIAIISIENIEHPKLRNSLFFSTSTIVPIKSNKIFFRYLPLSNFEKSWIHYTVYAELYNIIKN